MNDDQSKIHSLTQTAMELANKIRDLAGENSSLKMKVRDFENDPEYIATKNANAELYEAMGGLSDILNNHYGDDPDETPLIDKAFEVLKKYQK